MSFIPPHSPDFSDANRPDLPQDDPDRPLAPIVAPPGRSSSGFRHFPLHPNFGWAILWCIAMLLLTQVPGGVVGVVYIIAVVLLKPGALPSDQTGISEIISNPHVHVALGIGLATAHLLMILLSLLVLRVLVGRDWPREVALRPPSLIHVGLIVALMPAFIFLANMVFYGLRNKLSWPTFLDPKKMEGMQELEQLFNAWPISLTVLLIAVMPGLSEELWCRAFLGRGLVGIHGYVAGVLMTSLLFGAIHIDPCQGGMAAVVGLVLHYVYLMTRSLLAPMLLHFLNNAMSVILPRFDLVGQALEPVRIPDDLLRFMVLAAGLLLAASCYALYESRARLVATDGGTPWQPSYPGVACPPPGSNTVIVAPLPSLVSLFSVLLALGAFIATIAVAIQRVR